MGKRIGITGGIGSGKSVVSGIIRQMGYDVYDSDSQAKRLMNSNAHIISALKQRYGNSIYLNNELNSKLLAEKMFGNPAEVAYVNSIVHPVVFADFAEFAKTKDIVFIESAILYECGLDRYVDEVIYVDAPVDVRIERVIKRDSTTAAAIRKRIEHQQMSMTVAAQRADWTINNSGNENLNDEVQRVLDSCLNTTPMERRL